jgi:hypothetical protein
VLEETTLFLDSNHGPYRSIESTELRFSYASMNLGHRAWETRLGVQMLGELMMMVINRFLDLPEEYVPKVS